MLTSSSTSSSLYLPPDHVAPIFAGVLLALVWSTYLAALTAYSEGLDFWYAASVGAALICGTTAGGAAIGVLLGLPKGHPTVASEGPTAPTGWFLSGQNRLSDVADWLTKLLIGAGLTQIADITNKLHAWGWAAGRAMAVPAEFGTALVVAGIATGVLMGFVLSQFVLPLLHATLLRGNKDVFGQQASNHGGVATPERTQPAAASGIGHAQAGAEFDEAATRAGGREDLA